MSEAEAPAAADPHANVLDPVPQETVTTEVAEYTATAAGLAELQRKYGNVAWVVDTKKAEDDARLVRRELVSLRTGLDKLRLSKNADDQARINKRNAEAKRITGLIEALEAPVDEAIKAKEAKAEREKQERLAAEAARIADLRASIDEISAVALRAVNMTSAEIDKRLEIVTRIEITEAAYAELVPIAVNTKAETLLKLQDLRAAAVVREAAADKARRDAEELEQLRARQRQQEQEADAARQQELATRQAAETRQRAHDAYLASLRQLVRGLATATAEQIGQKILAVKALALPEGLGDLAGMAEIAKTDTLDELTETHAAVAQREAREREQQVEADRVRQQAEELAAAQQRVADAERAAALERAHAGIREIERRWGEAMANMDSEKVAALIAEIEALVPDVAVFGSLIETARDTQAEALSQMRSQLAFLKKVEEQPAAPAVVEPQPAPTQAFVVIGDVPDYSAAPDTLIQGLEITGAVIDELVDQREPIKLGEICTRLGVTMTAAFVEDTLKVVPLDSPGRAILFNAGDFDTICLRAQAHFEAKRLEFAA